MPSHEAYERLLGRFVVWAETVSDIRAAVIVGSRARTHHPADQWSDLDLIFMTSQPEFYINTTAWLDQIAPHWLTFVEKTATGEGHERRVMFEGAYDVDFIPVPADFSVLSLDPIVRGIFRRGARVVLDKDGKLTAALKDLLQPDDPGQTAHPPDETDILNVVHDFWYHAIWSAKKLRRDEVWMALSCINGYIKWQCVLPMITWHAGAAHGWDYDTWMQGRFLEKWADPRVITALEMSFGHYNTADLWRALFETMDLFGWLAAETVGKLGYVYPTQAEQHVAQWVRTCFEEHDLDE